MPKFPPVGEPNLDDPTSELEKAVNTSFDRLQGIVENVIPEIVNRPFGSTKEPIEQLKMEHDAGVAAGAAQFYSQKLQEFVAQEGEQRGLELFITYTEAMTK